MTDDRPKFDPDELAFRWKLDDMQKAFCLEILAGNNQSGAARAAGYPHEGIKLRKKASELAGTKKVQGFLADARKAGAEIADEPVMDQDARLRLLSRYAKSNDRQTALRAVELLDKIHTRQSEAPDLPGPETILRQIAAMSPLLGAILAHYTLGTDYEQPEVDAEAVRRWHCAACAEKIVSNLKADRTRPVHAHAGDPPFMNGHVMTSPGVEAE